MAVNEDSFHKDGLSIDGTTEYLEVLKEKFPNHISIYRKSSGAFWNGKIEMVNAPPLLSIKEQYLLWEIDVDEFWTAKQIDTAHQFLINNPKKFSDFYCCYYFVGPNCICL